MEKAKAQKKVISQWKPLKWTEYEKLPEKTKQEYNIHERQYNLERKWKRNSVEAGTKKLEKFFNQ